MRLPPLAAAAVLSAGLLCPAAASAHFVFLHLDTAGDAPTLRLSFGEDPAEEDEGMVKIVDGVTVTRHTPDGTTDEVTLKQDGGAYAADVSADPAGTVYTVAHKYGVTEGHGAGGPYLLEYHAAVMKEAAPADAGPEARPAAVNGQLLAVVPAIFEGNPGVRVLAGGVPVPGAEVHRPGMKREPVTTDGDGFAAFPADSLTGGPLAFRSNVVLPGAGVHEGKAFPETRRYATAVLTPRDFVKEEDAAATDAGNNGDGAGITVAEWAAAELPEGVTSLGGAVSGGYLYYYGGHPGTAHKYSTDEQSDKFRRLNLADPAAGWEDLPGGPKLQGLAMVPHPAGGVVRIGGFTARNTLEEDHDLHSSAAVAHFDPSRGENGEWVELPSLPGGRSSFDAAVLGDTVYVLGGWMMAGEQGEAWHGTGLKADLTPEPGNTGTGQFGAPVESGGEGAEDDAEPKIVWELLPSPPRPRRAVSVAAVPEAGEAGKIYLIGGMLPEGEITDRVDILDVAAGTWTAGPELPGEGMDGFGSSSFGVGDTVYATTLSGRIIRLKDGGEEWEELGDLDRARFFHRLLPDPTAGDDPAFLLIGGGSMTDGRFTEVDRVTIGAE